MSMVRRYFLVCSVFLLLDLSVADDVISTEYGPVKGVDVKLKTGKKLVKFLGIPFANASRFEAPRPPTRWNETLLATKHGKSCPQLTNAPILYLKPEDISEYCLYLDIYLPNTTQFQSKKASYPVLVMLHGGGYTLGGGFMLDGSILSTEGEIIVVTPNYRLGALGFYSLGEDEFTGNYALLDNIASLRWVKNNIKRFGGDPNKVTLGGWSAGARLASVLMMSPLANGLFDKAILMSGFAVAHYSYLEQAEAKNRAWYYAGLLRCPYPSKDFKDCMKRRSADDFVQAQTKMYKSMIFANWAPVVDGTILPDSPRKLLDEGKFNVTTIMAGVANDDGSAFLRTKPGSNDGVEVTRGLPRQEFISAISKKTWLRKQHEKVPEMIAFQYTDWSKPDDVNVTRRLYLDLLSDAIYKAPGIQSAKGFAKKKGASVYFYQFEYRPTYDMVGRPIPQWIRVAHGSDVQYIFPKPTMDSISGLTKTMVEFWINFIYKGDPTNPFWPKYDLKSQKYMAIRSFPKVETKLQAERMAFWNTYLPKTGRNQMQAPPKAGRHSDADKDRITMTLIIVSCLFAISLIIFVAIVITLVIKLKRLQSSSANYTAPVSHKDTTDFKSSPVHSPYLNESPMYKDSFKPIEKDPKPTQYNRNIEIYDQHEPMKDSFMESDML